MCNSLTSRGQVHLHYVHPMGVSCHTYKQNGQVKRLFLPGTWEPLGLIQSNLILYSAATIVGELLRGALDGQAYKLNVAYIEFENNNGAPVVPPTNTDRGVNLSYYASLANSPTRDYLRVPISAIVLDSTDVTKYPGGNRLTCFVETAGSVGVHGKPFSSVQHSRVYGGALAVSPQYDNPSRDILYSRVYFTTDTKQLIKPSNSQIAFRWPITLE